MLARIQKENLNHSYSADGNKNMETPHYRKEFSIFL